MFWYDICNDYSLELREFGPIERSVDSFVVEDLGVIHLNEFGEEVYLYSDRGDLEGFCIEGEF